MEVKNQTFSFMLLLLIQQLQHLIWTNSTGPLIVFSSTFKAKFKREGRGQVTFSILLNHTPIPPLLLSKAQP